MKKILLAYNPNAGKQVFKDDLDYIIKRFQENDQFIIPYRLGNKEKFNEFIINTDFNSIDKIIICGGDGTIHQTLNLLLNNKIKKPIGIFPIGTANDLAYSLNIPKDIDGMIDYCLSDKVKYIDIGKVNNEYFFNICSFGNLVDISQRVNKKMKGNIGVLAYYLKGIEEIPRMQELDINIEYDGISKDIKVLFALILNGKSAGGFRKIAPNALLDDGLLDIVLLKKCPMHDIMGVFIKLINGEHINSNNIEFLKVDNIKMKVNNEDDIISDIDGEKGPELPLEIKLIKSGLEIIS